MGSLLAPAPLAGEGEGVREEGRPSAVVPGKCSAGRREENWGRGISYSGFCFLAWELDPLGSEQMDAPEKME